MNKIKQLRTEKGLSQAKLAERLNVHQTAVSQWEKGRTMPDIEIAQRMAELFNVTLDYLLGRDTSPSANSNAIRVPVYGIIPAGIPMEAIEEVIDYEELDKSSWGNKDYFALKIKGSSMQPNYLDGDIVIFEKTCSCNSHDDCAVMINGDDATFKRVEKNENGIMLKALNPEYATLFYTNEQVENLPVRIIGVAKELRRKTNR